MTGGSGEGGGSEPDDNYLRLDGANNNPSPNNYLRKVDADILYMDINEPLDFLPLTGGTIVGLSVGDAGIGYTGATFPGGAANKIGFRWGVTGHSGLITAVVDNVVSYPVASNNTFAQYLPLSGGVMTGALQLNAGVDLGVIINTYDPSPGIGDTYWYQSRNIRFKDTPGAPSDSEGQDGDVCLLYTF